MNAASALNMAMLKAFNQKPALWPVFG